MTSQIDHWLSGSKITGFCQDSTLFAHAQTASQNGADSVNTIVAILLILERNNSPLYF